MIYKCQLSGVSCLLKKYMLLFLLLIFSGFANTQEIKELTVNDTVPAIAIRNLVNTTAGEINLSDYKGKLVILDFWATWCAPCVAALPKMQAFQEKFREKIQVIAVTVDKKKKVLNFLDNNRIGKQIRSIPIAWEDDVLHLYFKHKEVPHLVWIGQDGVVKAITSAQYATEKNIEIALQGRKLNWFVKKEVIEYDISVPLFQAPAFGGKDTYYAGFTGYVNGPRSGVYINRDSVNNYTRFNVMNRSLISQYAMALNFRSKYPLAKECLLDVKDENRFFYNPAKGYRKEWDAEYLYSYESVLPAIYTEKRIISKLKNDLDQFYSLDGSIVKRKQQCLVITTSPSIFDSLAPSEETIRREWITGEKGHIYRQTGGIYHLLLAMNKDSLLLPLPLAFSESKDTKRFDLELNLGEHPSDITVWKKELARYGIILTEEEREVELLSIIERNEP